MPMLNEHEKEQIRRAYFLEKQSIHQIAREQGHGRDTIRRVIRHDSSKPYQLTRPKPAPVFGPYQERVEALLQQNEQLPVKQRYTSHKIFEVLREAGYQGSESRIRQYITKRKKESLVPDVFLPLEFEPGQDAQVDWGEAQAIIKGSNQTVQFFLMRLCYSRRTFVMAFPTQKQESFLWAHVQAFKHFGGVPHRISYDNLGTAVKLVFEKTGKAVRTRQEVRAFVAFRSYYLFDSHFCTVGQGHEKGQVESAVGYSRRNFLVPPPQCTSFEDLNQQLLARCLKEDQRRVARQPHTIGDAWQQERPHLLPLPASDYECCAMTTVSLTPYSQATYETNRYSVPVNRARKNVTLKAYPFQIEIWDGVERLASHPRCYDREQDIFDPLHYLCLLQERPGAFDYAKPLKEWRANWPACYHQMLRILRDKWPEGRGVQEFVRILELHQYHAPSLIERAIEQALAYGCVHFDGVLYCLHQLSDVADREKSRDCRPLDLSHRPDLDAIGNQPIDLSRYEQLLKLSW